MKGGYPHALASRTTAQPGHHSGPAGGAARGHGRRLRLREKRVPGGWGVEKQRVTLDIYGAGPAPAAAAAPRTAPAAGREMAAARQPGQAVAVIISTRGAPNPGHLTALQAHRARVRHTFRIIHAIAATVPADILDVLAAKPWVERIEPDRPVYAVLDQSVPSIQVPAVWKLGLDGSGVTVAVVDTGVDLKHPHLKRIAPGFNAITGGEDAQDDHGHGTHVAGIVASSHPQYTGVAPGATILPVKVLGAGGSGTESNVIAGLEWALAHGAQVVNMSLGTSTPGDGSSPLSRAVDNAAKQGVAVVVAAGNNGPAAGTVGSPGDARLAITVGAVDNQGALASFSSRGPTLDGRVKPDLVAPGVAVRSLQPRGRLASYSGTSMAAPHVAGVAALLTQAWQAGGLVVARALGEGARDLQADPNAQGRGWVDALASWRYLKEQVEQGAVGVRPGEAASFRYRVTNLGPQDDEIALGFRSPSLPREWVTMDAAVRLPAGASAELTATVAVPAGWAEPGNRQYPFWLTAASSVDAYAVAEDIATLTVIRPA